MRRKRGENRGASSRAEQACRAYRIAYWRLCVTSGRQHQNCRAVPEPAERVTMHSMHAWSRKETRFAMKLRILQSWVRRASIAASYVEVQV